MADLRCALAGDSLFLSHSLALCVGWLCLQLSLEKKLRDILVEEKERAIEEAKLAAGLCSQGGMMP